MKKISIFLFAGMLFSIALVQAQSESFIHYGTKLVANVGYSYIANAFANAGGFVIEKESDTSVVLKITQDRKEYPLHFSKRADNLYFHYDKGDNYIKEAYYFLLLEKDRAYFYQAKDDLYYISKPYILVVDRKLTKGILEDEIEKTIVSLLDTRIKSYTETQYKSTDPKLVFSSQPYTATTPKSDAEHHFTTDKEFHARLYLSADWETMVDKSWGESSLKAELRSVEKYGKTYADSKSITVYVSKGNVIDFDMLFNDRTINFFGYYSNSTYSSGFYFPYNTDKSIHGYELIIKNPNGDIIARNYFTLEAKNTTFEEFFKTQKGLANKVSAENVVKATGIPAEYAAAQWKGKFTDPVLSVESIKKIIKASESDVASISRVSFGTGAKDWDIIKNDLGLILRKESAKNIFVVYKTTDNACYYSYVTIVKSYEGAGVYADPDVNFDRTPIQYNCTK